MEVGDEPLCMVQITGNNESRGVVVGVTWARVESVLARGIYKKPLEPINTGGPVASRCGGNINPHLRATSVTVK